MDALRYVVTQALIVVALFAAPCAFGQLEVVHPPESLYAGQQANAFLEWRGMEPLDGLRIATPPGWSVRRVDVVQSGSMKTSPLRLSGGGALYRARSGTPLRGELTLVVALTTGPVAGYHTVALSPIVGGASLRSQRAEWQAVVREVPPTGENGAFRLTADAPPLLVRRAALPSLDPRDPSTIEVWIKTVGLDEVVLSTWDGDEDRPYPVEFIVDALGRAVVYRGRPGRHDALRSGAPVADGQWHHVAVVNDPSARWARLFVDGTPADSVRSEGGTLNTMSLALGGRPDRSGAEQGRLFTGALDELRVWNIARSAAGLQRTMRARLANMPEGAFRLGFDDPLPPDVLVAEPVLPVRAPSDLAFGYPVEALEAAVRDGIVTLTWQTKDRRAEAFRIERSTDGRRFTEVGNVRAGARIGETVAGAVRFAYTDLVPEGDVLFYRVRQLSPDGTEHVSGAYKLGLGVEEAAVTIVGNSPNPFRSNTVVTYKLSRPLPVRLTVWDIVGTRVAVLVDERQAEGRHEYRFSADDLPSGVYFVRLETPAGSAAHKMTLTR